MANIKIADVVKPFCGEGDVTVWLKKLKMVVKSQKVGDLAIVMPMFLEGAAYTVFDQMEEGAKSNADAIEKVLLEAFSINGFTAYGSFRQRNWEGGEQVDVYLSELRKLPRSANVDSEELIKCASSLVSQLRCRAN